MLTFDKLIAFDLGGELDKQLLNPKNHARLLDFLGTVHEIHTVDQFIRDCPSFPGSTDRIIRSEMLSAIGSTLAIEGRKLTQEEIEECLQKAENRQELGRVQQEVENARLVYDFIRGYFGEEQGELVFTEAIICQIHKLFTDGLNYLGNAPGQYRGEFATTFGWPRRPGLCRTNSEVTTAMRGFVTWLNKTGQGVVTGNNIVKAIMAHYYLTEIHPFADGNGRTARALEALILFVNKINVYCFWSLANFWSIHRDQYIDQLGKVAATCDPWDFLIWGMKGYLDEIKRIKDLVLRKVKQLMFMDYTRYLLRFKTEKKVKINQRIVDVLSLLTRWGPIPLQRFLASAEVTALYRSVSEATRSRDFKKMGKLRLVTVSNKSDDDRQVFIEPNYQILETLEYKV